MGKEWAVQGEGESGQAEGVAVEMPHADESTSGLPAARGGQCNVRCKHVTKSARGNLMSE